MLTCAVSFQDFKNFTKVGSTFPKRKKTELARIQEKEKDFGFNYVSLIRNIVQA